MADIFSDDEKPNGSDVDFWGADYVDRDEPLGLLDAIGKAANAMRTSAKKEKSGMKAKFIYKGGKGSGFHGHAGIPGHQGGSAPSGTGDGASSLNIPSIDPVRVYNSRVSAPKGWKKTSPSSGYPNGYVEHTATVDGHEVRVRLSAVLNTDTGIDTTKVHLNVFVDGKVKGGKTINPADLQTEAADMAKLNKAKADLEEASRKRDATALTKIQAKFPQITRSMLNGTEKLPSGWKRIDDNAVSKTATVNGIRYQVDIWHGGDNARVVVTSGLDVHKFAVPYENVNKKLSELINTGD